ncbi:zinc dependent phospholipase C family protein [Clostridium manihotivorum]|uniref:zinc dependent phospholipase C family protein n=1 Tax=Clostridium manihotivorum TaxID=2320868 RepID=UPI001EE5A6AE|nr:zinc dependent phospholipase C family protein [Clostridium manihotivorum]
MNKRKFMYGNVKPDFECNTSNQHHTMGETIEDVKNYCHRLLNDNLSKDEFSITLGMVCHFICDYFCLYHREEYKNKSFIAHLLYEVFLHINLRLMLILGLLNSSEQDELYIQNPITTLMELQDSYLSSRDSVKKDIKYAILASKLISCSIIAISISTEKEDFTDKLLISREFLV